MDGQLGGVTPVLGRVDHVFDPAIRQQGREGTELLARTPSPGPGIHHEVDRSDHG